MNEEILVLRQKATPEKSHHYQLAYLGIETMFDSLFCDYYNNFDNNSFLQSFKIY